MTKSKGGLQRSAPECSFCFEGPFQQRDDQLPSTESSSKLTISWLAFYSIDHYDSLDYDIVWEWSEHVSYWPMQPVGQPEIWYVSAATSQG